MVQIDEIYREASGKFTVPPETLERVKAAMEEAAFHPEEAAAQEAREETVIPVKWYRRPQWVRGMAFAAACICIAVIGIEIPSHMRMGKSAQDGAAVVEETAEEIAWEISGDAGKSAQGTPVEKADQTKPMEETTDACIDIDVEANYGVLPAATEEEARQALFAGLGTGEYDSSLLTEEDIVKTELVEHDGAWFYRFSCTVNGAMRSMYPEAPETVVFEITALTESAEE